MNNTIRYYVKNRFMYIFAVWAFSLIYTMTTNNPHLNAMVIGFSFIAVIMAASYMFEQELNASERLFFNKVERFFND